jgi:acyl carrier protein
MTMATEAEIFDKVQESLVEALGVDEDEVTPEATLMGDLGAESIDFLDIFFRLEKAFDIKIPRGELYPEDLAGNPEFVEGTRLTPAGVAELERRMPFADLSGLSDKPELTELSNLLNVQMLVNYIKYKLQG